MFDNQLIKDLYNMHVNGFEKSFCNVINTNNFDIIYNNRIKNYYDNFISNFNINNTKELEQIINEAKPLFDSIDKKIIVNILPFMGDCYYNKEKYFTEQDYKHISEETWQIFDNFENINIAENNCKYNVKLKPVKNMVQYAKYLLKCFKSEDINDPYGDIDIAYENEFAKFKCPSSAYECNAYYITANDKIVGVSNSIHNKKYYGLYAFAIENKYRKMGIGTATVLEHLSICKEHNIDLLYLQTEKGYYPYQMYKKIGFRDLFTSYYYEKN